MNTPGPCAKQVVTCTIGTPGGQRHVGTNGCAACSAALRSAGVADIRFGPPP